MIEHTSKVSNKMMNTAFVHTAKRCASALLQTGNTGGLWNALQLSRFKQTDRPAPTERDLGCENNTAGGESAERKRNMKGIMGIKQNYLLRIKAKGATAAPPLSSVIGETKDMPLGIRLGHTRLKVAFAKVLAVAMLFGFSGEVKAQESEQEIAPTQYNTLMSLIESQSESIDLLSASIQAQSASIQSQSASIQSQSSTIELLSSTVELLFTTMLAGFGSIIVIGGGMFWTLNRKIDGVKDLMNENEIQNQKEHHQLQLEIKDLNLKLSKVLWHLEGQQNGTNSILSDQAEAVEGTATATATG